MAAKPSVAEELLNALQIPRLRPMPLYISEADTVSVEDFMQSRYARNYVLDISNIHWGGELNSNHVFDIFADYHSCRDSNKVRLEIRNCKLRTLCLGLLHPALYERTKS